MGHALTCLQPRNKLDDQEDEIEVTHDVYTKTIRECPAESNEIPPAGSFTPASFIIESVNESECVMCLDTFDETNPKVRTLCNCGMNRTNFHLSCLHEWTQRSSLCPVCRQTLFYEEFE